MAGVVSDKLVALSGAAEFDICASCDPPRRPDFSPSITRLLLPNGGTLSVLKILLSDACGYDCFYCANRAGRRVRRHSFKPDELASVFVDLEQRGLVSGLFLSSGIHRSPAETMGEMITTAEILRARHGFRGYMHLKVLPGAPYDCVERAVELADRVSVNVEAPTQRSLDHLATRKRLSEGVISRMQWVRKAARRAGEGKLRSGQTTQFVVGAAGESDREILTCAEGLRRSVGLRRAYFSAFRPVPDTPLAGEPPAPPMRQHRLYQAEWLLRCYGFGLPEIAFGQAGRLPLDVDPKLAFALIHRERFPVEVNRATRRELLRVPGIGPRSAERILAARRRGRITSLEDLRGFGAAASRAGPFLLVDGRRGGDLGALVRRVEARREQLELSFAATG